MDNIKMDLGKTVCEDGKWVELAQNRVLAMLNHRLLLPQFQLNRTKPERRPVS